MMKSCLTCPSYLTDQTAISVRFGRATGANMCGRFGHVMSRRGLDDDQQLVTAQHFALNCEHHNEPMPTEVPVTIAAFAFAPDPDVEPSGKVIGTCQACAYCVPAEEADRAHGFGTPVCRAKGNLIIRPLNECKGCEFAEPDTAGTVVKTLDDRPLIPWLEANFKLDQSQAINSLTNRTETAVDPREYPTDAEVSDEDRALGYRAWRRIPDPEGQYEDAWLPIYDPEYLTPAERALIPQAGGDEHVELYTDYWNGLRQFAVEAVELGETIALIGRAGVGKTEFARWLAWLMQVPFYRFSINKSSEVVDLVGGIAHDPERGTYFDPGRFLIAYGRPGVSMVDEINLGRNEIREFFRPITDNSAQVVVENVIFPKHHGHFVMMSLNPSWDPNNIGTEEFASADANRLTPIWVEQPPEPVERLIVQERCALDGYEIPEDTLDTIMKIAEDIRQFSEDGIFSDWWGTRQQIKVARKSKWYPLPMAYKRAALDFYEPKTVDLIMSAVTSKIPSAPVPDPNNPF